MRDRTLYPENIEPAPSKAFYPEGWGEVPPINEWPEHEKREFDEWLQSILTNPHTGEHECPCC